MQQGIYTYIRRPCVATVCLEFLLV
eukprot:COSAG06_NODE_46948_length_343_cov_0.627049_1_plen_24_part_01